VSDWWATAAKAVGMLVCLVMIAGCSLISIDAPALPTIPPDAHVDCGPVVDQALCETAVAVAITAQLNPPPIVEARLRPPRPDDDCVTALRPCGADAIIVVLQSGDTIQDVPLIRTDSGWVRLDLVR
jgi:hypothetical protein